MGPIDPILRVWGWGGRVVGRDGPYCFDRGLLSLYCCPYCCCSHYYCCPHSPPSPFSTPWFLHATYTADSGERRLRIFNQRLQSTSTYPRLFKGLDGVAVMLSLARTAALQLDSTRLPDVRSNFEDTVETILTQYRAQCSASSSTGQLVLPENGKLLPLFANCVLKSPLLLLNEPSRFSLDTVYPRGDTRAWAIHVRVFSVHSSVVRLAVQSDAVRELRLPRSLQTRPRQRRLGPRRPRHRLRQQAFVRIPHGGGAGSRIRVSIGRMARVRILFAGPMCRLMLVVSNQVPAEVMESLFGVRGVTDEAMANGLMLQREGDELCERVNTLVEELQAQLGCYLQVGEGRKCENSLPS